MSLLRTYLSPYVNGGDSLGPDLIFHKMAGKIVRGENTVPRTAVNVSILINVSPCITKICGLLILPHLRVGRDSRMVVHDQCGDTVKYAINFLECKC